MIGVIDCCCSSIRKVGIRSGVTIKSVRCAYEWIRSNRSCFVAYIRYPQWPCSICWFIHEYCSTKSPICYIVTKWQSIIQSANPRPSGPQLAPAVAAPNAPQARRRRRSIWAGCGGCPSLPFMSYKVCMGLCIMVRVFDFVNRYGSRRSPDLKWINQDWSLDR